MDLLPEMKTMFKQIQELEKKRAGLIEEAFGIDREITKLINVFNEVANFNTSCYLCDGCGYLAHAIGNEEFLCPDCGGTGKKTEKPKHQSID
jgi:rubrerythrin